MGVEEDGWGGDASHETAPPLVEVVRQGRRRGPHDGDEALLRPLAEDTEHLLVEQHLPLVEVAELGDAQPAAVEHLEHGAVALTGGGMGEGLVEKGGGLLARDHVGQAGGLGGQGQVGRGMDLGDLLGHHEAVEALDRRHRALDRRGGEPHVLERLDVAANLLARDGIGSRDAILREEGEIAVEIASVCLDRVRGAPPLHGEVVEVLPAGVREVHGPTPSASRRDGRSPLGGRWRHGRTRGRAARDASGGS